MLKNRVTDHSLSTVMWLALVLLALVLAGCASAPKNEDTHILARVPDAEMNRATVLAAQGKVEEAAALYLALANTARPPARAQLQFKAADVYLNAGQTLPASKILDAMAQQDLTSIQRERLALTQADLALLTGRPQDAIRFLERMQVHRLPQELKIRRLGTLASAQRLANTPLDAAKTLSDLDRLLDANDIRLVNQVSLLSTLNLLPQSELQKLTRSGPWAMRGWADIALLARQAGANPAALETRYRQWRRGRAGHPALPELARAYSQNLSGGYASSDTVTVMLPRSGRFAAAAKAVREGIEAASRVDIGMPQPRLDFADSTNAGRVRAIHAKASKDGAHYVIGPLEKSAVDALAGQRALTVPTLALNESTRAERRTANLFQFSLSPENEADEVANKAYARGLRRALLLYPEGAWGNRLASAFSQQWLSLGGSLAGQSSFNPAASNQSKTVQKLLDGTSADVLFLVATADMARTLHPAIRTASTRPLTVISTSHVYVGTFDPKRDAGLVGLYFVDIPWMFGVGGDGPLARQRLSNSTDPLARLHAMGIDAYRLAPRLANLAKNPGAYYPGQTGGLSLNSLGRIQRQLELGYFADTGPRLADPATTPRPSNRSAFAY